MSKDKAIEEGMRRRRPPADIESDVASTIFGDMADEAQAGRPIPLEQIAGSRFQSRAKLDLDHVETLVGLIQKGGLLSPVLVRPIEGKENAYELVAGHHRLEAFRRLNRGTIPAIVRRMTDAEAARALTSENTARKDLSDWEQYKHMVMLREQNAVQNKTEMAEVLAVSRTQVYNLEAFELLPESLHALLDEVPDLVGASLVYGLKPLLEDRDKGERVKLLVDEAFRLVEAKKLKQAGVPGWIGRKLEGPVPTGKSEYTYKTDGHSIKLVLGANSAKISGEYDPAKLQQLIQDNLDKIRKE